MRGRFGCGVPSRASASLAAASALERHWCLFPQPLQKCKSHLPQRMPYFSSKGTMHFLQRGCPCSFQHHLQIMCPHVGHCQSPDLHTEVPQQKHAHSCSHVCFCHECLSLLFHRLPQPVLFHAAVSDQFLLYRQSYMRCAWTCVSARASVLLLASSLLARASGKIAGVPSSCPAGTGVSGGFSL